MILTLDLKQQQHNIINQIDFLPVELLGNNYYLGAFQIIFFIHHIFFSIAIFFLLYNMHKRSYFRPSFSWTALVIPGEDFGSQHVGRGTVSLS